MKEYRGLGGTYKRNKIWWIHYSARGVVYRETSKSPEEKDAIKLLKTRIGDIANGKTLGSKAERVTLKDLVEALRNDYERMRRRSTRLIDRVEHHLIAHFGENARAIDIKEAKILEYEKARKSQLVNHTVKYVETHKSQLFENDKTYSEALKMQHKGRMMVAPSDSTVSGELRLLRYAFNIMVDARRLSHDDVPKFPVLVESPARQGFIDPPEFKRLLDALPDDLKDPVAFQYHSGWRKNEMQTLDWSDVDIANGTIRLRPEHSKNGHARPLKLRGEMLAIIKRAADRRDPAITFVFHRDGQPIGDFRKAWKKACSAAGLGAMLVHDLRRSAVRNMIRSGVNQHVAMAISGHRTATIFERYDIIDETDLEKAAGQIDTYYRDRSKRKPKVVPLRQQSA